MAPNTQYTYLASFEVLAISHHWRRGFRIRVFACDENGHGACDENLLRGLTWHVPSVRVVMKQLLAILFITIILRVHYVYYGFIIYI